MADAANRPLTRASVLEAHERIKPYIHLTPVVTSQTLSDLASTLHPATATVPHPSSPRITLFFKCENYQKIGAFKARGAFHALSRLTAGELEAGVITHSSGNHAQALALAARTRGVPAHIVMPRISTPSKIAATRGYGAHVHFSGSTAPEREACVARVRAEEGGPVLVPPYDHPDVLLGQGTMAIEFEQQVKEMLAAERESSIDGFGWRSRQAQRAQRAQRAGGSERGAGSEGLDAVVAPCGGGGMLSGIATALAGTGIAVFGAEPQFEGADDLCRGLKEGKRVESVKTLTIADGLRTPVGKIPWSIISDKSKVRGAYSVTEEEIKAAMRLVFERMKVVVEPSGAVALAVVLFNEDFRQLVEREAGDDGWNIGVIFSGGNTTMEAIAKLYEPSENIGERAEGKVGIDGEKVAENVAG
ncbi:hypothetical protein FH972_022351 [Carpinus fangiana]|uniref:Tryptophan synthase beta chain-like PALP domain-containing protein n=1 Tax=Carpinus fangiana TaxID=176857 RepID=A0A5N6KU84_9ROSI|nr:hypothetical protein FH972_022351 [Carpinus fangiana]